MCGKEWQKLNDNEIIKALECCSRNNCSGCPLSHKSIKDCLKTAIKATLDIINRQKAIFDCLEGNDFIQIEANFAKVMRAVKNEAYKKFADKAAAALANAYTNEYAHWIDDTLDVLLKELVGEDE
uniref:NifU-like protein n=1 Tax=Siphoviridae sp. ctiMP24 TaxID=2825621 RepID=A0A8S5NZ65_9CAUD|nr:MAG TPA: NifU-like protein [Siphoviridae sp. ctiMP24]